MFAYPPALAGAEIGFAVVTDRFLCLLGPEATPQVASELYRLLDADDSHIDHVLDLMVTHDEVKRFAIVEVIDPAERSMHVAVFGLMTVDIVGNTSTRLSGPTGATRITSEARGVSSLWLSLESSEPSGERLPIRRGVVMTTAIMVDGAGPTPQVHTDSDDQFPATVPIEIPRAARLEKVASGPTPKPTAARQGAKRKPVKKTPVAVQEQPIHDDVVVWGVRLPDGNELDAATPIVIGRRPWGPGADEEPAVHVAAPSPRREISGVHVELAVVDGELRARDLNSTNGTIVFTESRAPRLLHEGKTTSLRAGDILDLGESFQILITSQE